MQQPWADLQTGGGIIVLIQVLTQAVGVLHAIIRAIPAVEKITAIWYWPSHMQIHQFLLRSQMEPMRPTAL